MFHLFRRPIDTIPLPQRFTDPFQYTPHPLCVAAAEEIRAVLAGREEALGLSREGKMFGVLIVGTPAREIGFLAAFSGILAGSYRHPYFVPPVYDLQQPSGFFQAEEQAISALNKEVRQIEQLPEYERCRELLLRARARAEEILHAARTELKAAKAARDRLRRLFPEGLEAERLVRESQHGKASYKRLERLWKTRIDRLQQRTDTFTARIDALKQERRQRSAALQQRLFEQFSFLNARGEEKNLCELFRDTAQRTPPAGAGECAAPKLLQYAYAHGLRPLAMAEFWWGAPSATEIRRPGIYYPACKGKCQPILQHMLQGLEVEGGEVEGLERLELQGLELELETATERPLTATPAAFPEIVYEDAWLTVINKPAGMLSVPGKIRQPSVYDLVHARYPEAGGPLIVHRLDMATSGLLLIAKSKAVHKQLQRQFLLRRISKRYVALLDGTVAADEGVIRLPLCPDPHDRPRQTVHETFGKPAVTRYRVTDRNPRRTRIFFFPETGRTHQLRIHAAHPRGLNCPIAGDTLYGLPADRLYLHAEFLEFTHPVTGQQIRLEKKADF